MKRRFDTSPILIRSLSEFSGFFQDFYGYCWRFFGYYSIVQILDRMY